MTSLVKNAAWAAGFAIRRRQPTDLGSRRVLLARNLGVDTILDVGANEGQWAQRLRKDGYVGVIHSFEPLADAYQGLYRRSSRDHDWYAHNLGLGATIEERVIHVAGNSTSSSFLPMAPAHAEAAPYSTYVGEQSVSVVTLDSLWTDGFGRGDRLYLKIDVQGGEMDVLRGAQSALTHVQLLELEMSLVPLYEGQTLSGEMSGFLGSQGFELVGLDEGFADPRTGRLLQYDAIYRRGG